MIGKNTIIIDWQDFIKGMSSSPEIGDGGFSPNTEALNPLVLPGVLYAPGSAVDSDTDNRLTGTIIASSPDHNVFGGDNNLLVASDATLDGTFYRYNGTKIIADAYATDTTNDYQEGFTSIINYKGETYVTTKQLIKRWTSTGTIADLSGGGFTNTTYPHPAIVYEDNAYYGDGNLLLRQTAANGAPATILTLPASEIIIALGVDPGTGKMLISTTSSLNISGTIPGRNLLQWYDGNSNKLTKYVEIGDVITSFQSVENTVYVGYGKSVGYVNGSGIKWLRDLVNATFDFEDLPYKGKIASIGNTLFVVDGNEVLAFGEMFAGGQKVWYKAAQNEQSSDNLTSIFYAGNASSTDTRKLGLAYETSAPAYAFHTVDLTDTSGLDGFVFETNFIYFPQPVAIANVALEFYGAISSTANLSLTYYDNTSPTAGTTIAIRPTQTNLRTIEFTQGLPDYVWSFKIRLESNTTNAGLKRIIIQYDPQ